MIEAVTVGSPTDTGSAEDVSAEDEPPTLPSKESRVVVEALNDVANVTPDEVEAEITLACFGGSLLTCGGKYCRGIAGFIVGAAWPVVRNGPWTDSKINEVVHVA